MRTITIYGVELKVCERPFWRLTLLFTVEPTKQMVLDAISNEIALEGNRPDSSTMTLKGTLTALENARELASIAHAATFGEDAGKRIISVAGTPVGSVHITPVPVYST
jgi:hypothetical protein